MYCDVYVDNVTHNVHSSCVCCPFPKWGSGNICRNIIWFQSEEILNLGASFLLPHKLCSEWWAKGIGTKQHITFTPIAPHPQTPNRDTCSRTRIVAKHLLSLRQLQPLRCKDIYHLIRTALLVKQIYWCFRHLPKFRLYVQQRTWSNVIGLMKVLPYQQICQWNVIGAGSLLSMQPCYRRVVDRSGPFALVQW